MTSKNSYNWALIYRQIREALESGKCNPSWARLSEYLDVPESTLVNGLRREYNIGSVIDLENIPSSPWPSELTEFEVKRLPEQYQGIDPAQVVKLLKKEPLSLSELSDRLDRGQTSVNMAVQAMILDGYALSVEEGKITLPEYTPADPFPTLYDLKSTTLKWLSISDTHIGSTHAQISAMRKIIQIAYDEYEVTNVFHSGDVHAGIGVYRGQHNELYAHGGDDQAEAAAMTFPEHKGLKYYMLDGNHDHSFMKQNGFDVVRKLCDMREDMIYCGFDQSEIPVLKNKDDEVIASAVLWHPSGGKPYAVSYRGQKFAAEISQKELLDVIMEDKIAPTVRWIIWGHLHVSDIFPHGPMWVYGPGCFEGTNGYLKAKGYIPMIMGIINETEITDNGLIKASHFHPIQFIEQENDYMCGYIPSMKRRTEKIEPVFSVE